MSFGEEKLGKNFCRVATEACLSRLRAATSINLISIPGVGVSYFLRYVSTRAPYAFLHINTYEMPEFSKQALWRQLAMKCGLELSDAQTTPSLVDIKQKLQEMLATHERVVLIFNRVDRIAALFDQNFTDNLRYLQDGDVPRQIVFIFVSHQPLQGLHHQLLLVGPKIFSDTVYFTPYSQADLLAIAKLDGLSAPRAEVAARLAGGHHSLFHTLYRCQDIQNPLADPMVELLVTQIVNSLGPKRQDNLVKALGQKRSGKTDEYLLKTGFLRRLPDGSLRPFTPLLADYTLRHAQASLPHKEARLWRLLKKNLGRVVTKQTIFDHVWGDEVAGDWALNSLVYRLRRHSAFDTKRYTITSVKKDGYMLIDGGKAR